MPPSKLAEQRARAAESAAPLAADTLDGLTGEALREALLARVADALPREGDALRRAAKARGSVARAGVHVVSASLRGELARAELESALLRARAGRNLLARTVGAGSPATPDGDD